MVSCAGARIVLVLPFRFEPMRSHATEDNSLIRIPIMIGNHLDFIITVFLSTLFPIFPLFVSTKNCSELTSTMPGFFWISFELIRSSFRPPIGCEPINPILIRVGPVIFGLNLFFGFCLNPVFPLGLIDLNPKSIKPVFLLSHRF